jgi:hypothetical protein
MRAPLAERLGLSLDRRATLRRLGALPISRRLSLLAAWYGTDKGRDAHDYTQHYQRYLGSRRRERLRILEIGVGGQETNSGGASLRMWRSFFPKAEVIGVDLYEKQLPAEARIRVLQGDQSDATFLRALGSREGPFDLVVDDGSHRGDYITLTFTNLWPFVSPGGVYVIEDLETAYDEDYGGGSPGTSGTAMTLLKELLDAGQQEADWPDVDGVAVHHGIGFVFRTR